MNNVFLIGRLANNIVLKVVNVAEEEGVVTRFSLAVDNGRKNTDNNTDFFSCVAWNNIAKAIEKYVKKGHKLAVQGHLKPNNYKKDGESVYSMDVVVDRVDFMSNSKNEKEDNAAGKKKTELQNLDDENVIQNPDDENVNMGSSFPQDLF